MIKKVGRDLPDWMNKFAQINYSIDGDAISTNNEPVDSGGRTADEVYEMFSELLAEFEPVHVSMNSDAFYEAIGDLAYWMDGPKLVSYDEMYAKLGAQGIFDLADKVFGAY